MSMLLFFPCFPLMALSFRTESGLNNKTEGRNIQKETWESMTKYEQYLQMALMANATYNSEPVDGWEIYDSIQQKYNASGIENSVKHIATLYHRPAEKLCALAFSGTVDGRDLRYDFNIIPRAYCGMYGVHSGFANALDKFWKKDYGKALVRQVEGQMCQNGTLVVGHSLGGAKAVLFAACNNRQVKAKQSQRAPEKSCKTICKRDTCQATATNAIALKTPYVWVKKRTISLKGCCAWWQGGCDECCPYTQVSNGGHVIGVYTFGAPAVSLASQLENRKRADRSFPGARFYIFEDVMKYDEVPNLFTHLHFLHPKMNAIKLGAVGEAAALKMWSFRNKFSRKAPNINLPFALHKMKIEYITSVAAHLTNQLSGSDEEVNPHLMTSYIKRLEALQWCGQEDFCDVQWCSVWTRYAQGKVGLA